MKRAAAAATLRGRTSFVGRVEDLAWLDDAFRGGARLVTLVGPGGMGKTRLARRYAASQLESFGEVWFCDLTEALSLGGLVVRVGAAFDLARGAQEGGGLDELGRALRLRGDLLLVLDNVEQITGDAAQAVTALLEDAPAARFLVTSREALGVEGELRRELLPLEEEEAALLFETRAIALGRRAPDLTKQRPHTLTIVRRVDRIPLAVELAASRATLLDLPELAARLSEKVGWLKSDRRDATARQATLRAAIGWSWGLLSAAEKRALACSSVFRGGFSVAAAEVVVGEAPNETPLETLEALRNKSLFHEVSGDAAGFRLGMYETIREFAQEALDASGERGAAEERHADYFLQLVRSETPPGRHTLDAEASNLLAAHAWLLAHDPAASVEVLGALATTMLFAGPMEAYVQHVDASIRCLEAAAGPRAVAALAEALCMRGEVQRMRGLSAEAARDLERALEIAREAGERAVEGRARIALGMLGWLLGRDGEARAHATAALELWTVLGDRAKEGLSRCLLGMAAQTARAYGEATRELEAALGLVRAAGDRASEVIVLTSLAVVVHEEGRLARAKELYEEALALVRDVGDRRYEGPIESALGQIALELEDDVEADRRFDDALRILEELGVRRHQAMTLARMGSLALIRGDVEEAQARLRLAEERVRGLGDRREGLYGAWAAAALAARGQEALAEEKASDARRSLERVADPGYLAAQWVLEGFTDLARGHVAGAAEHLDGERESGRAARASSDGRAALRALRAALARRAADQPAGAATTAPVSSRAPSALVIGPDARWFEVTRGRRVDVSRRHALRLLLRALAERRVREPSIAMTLTALFRAGWPGERASPLAAARRVYTAIGMLRDMGLRPLLVRRDDGYLLDPDVPLETPDWEL